MNFLNNLNDFFMSKDYSADQGGSDSKGADGASNADSGVDENGSGVVGVHAIRPVVSADFLELIVGELKEDIAEHLKSLENFKTPKFDIGLGTEFTKVVSKSGGGEVDASNSPDASNSQAGKKRKNISESPANYDGPRNSVGGFSACRSKGLDGFGGSSSNGASAANGNTFDSSNSPDASNSQAGKKRKNISESPANYDGPRNSAGVFGAVRSQFSNVSGLDGFGGSSSNGAGAANRAGEATSSSPFDTSPILPSQDESDQSKAALTKTRKLERAIVNARELETLKPFWASLNDKPRKLRSTTNAYSSKIDAPVDYDWKSLNPNVNQPTPTTRKLEIDIDSEAHQTRNDKRKNRSGSSANGGGALDKDGVFNAVRSRSLKNVGAVGGSSSSDRGGFGGVGGSSSSDRGGFGGVGGSSSNGNNNDDKAQNPDGGFGVKRRRGGDKIPTTATATATATPQSPAPAPSSPGADGVDGKQGPASEKNF